VARLTEALEKIGPMAQLLGQTRSTDDDLDDAA